MIKNYKKKLLLLAVCIFYIGLTVYGSSLKRHMTALYPSVSLRYSQGIDRDTAETVRKYADEQDTGLWPSFWSEQSSDIDISGQENPLSVQTIFYSGDLFSVWPAEFRFGGAPGDLDTNGCIISTELAWQLWGGLNAVDQTCIIEGKERIVRGVFEHDLPLAVVNVSLADVKIWKNIELSGNYTGDERMQAETFAEESGLDKPDSVVNGYLMQGFASALTFLPLIIIILSLIIYCITRLKHIRSWIRLLMIFSVCFCFSLMLPWFLTFIPSWSTPTKWSDFTFWSGLFTQFQGYMQEWFLLPPYLKDAEAKWVIAKLFFTCFASGSAILVIFSKITSKKD